MRNRFCPIDRLFVKVFYIYSFLKKIFKITSKKTNRYQVIHLFFQSSKVNIFVLFYLHFYYSIHS